MKILSYKDIRLSKKMNSLVILALVLSQSSVVIEGMVPWKNTHTTTETLHEQGATLIYPRLAEEYELTSGMDPKDVFFNNEDYFFKTIETIAQNSNNLTHQETLIESINIILKISTLNKKYRFSLKKLLNNYTNDEYNQDSHSVKVMRYILTKADPELGEEALLLNTLGQASELLARLNTINVLTYDQVQHSNLINTETIAGKMYLLICKQESKITIIRFFDKIKKAFDGNQEGLQKALTQKNNSGNTALHKAAESNNPEVIRAIFTVFVHNQEGLRQALAQKNNDGDTPLHWAVENNNPDITILFINALQKTFANNKTGLQHALTQQDNYGDTPLHLAIGNNNSGVIIPLINALQHAFAANEEELKHALTQENNDGHTPLHWATDNKSPEVITTLFQALQLTFNQNQSGLQHAFVQQDDDGYTALHIATGSNNHESMKALLESLEKAFAGNKEGLQDALTRQDNNGLTPLHVASLNKNLEISSSLLYVLKNAFRGNQTELQDALTQENHQGYTPLKLAAQNNNLEVVALIKTAIDQGEEAINAQ